VQPKHLCSMYKVVPTFTHLPIYTSAAILLYACKALRRVWMNLPSKVYLHCKTPLKWVCYLQGQTLGPTSIKSFFFPIGDISITSFIFYSFWGTLVHLIIVVPYITLQWKFIPWFQSYIIALFSWDYAQKIFIDKTLMLKTVHFFSIYLFVTIFHFPYWLHAQVMPSYLKGLPLHTGCLLAFFFFSFVFFLFLPLYEYPVPNEQICL